MTYEDILYDAKIGSVGWLDSRARIKAILDEIDRRAVELQNSSMEDPADALQQAMSDVRAELVIALEIDTHSKLSACAESKNGQDQHVKES